MKIGIITHHYINNFGAFLQCWALQEKLKSLFPEDEVYIINYIMPMQRIINIGGLFRYYPKSETPVAWLNKITLPFIYRAERKKYMNVTKPVFSAEGINKLGMDCIIVGSDEVWNYLDKKCYSTVKFGVGLDCKKLIAYAPSVGKTTEENIPSEICDGLSRFTLLSARDVNTQNLCVNAINKKPQLVCDPTFLTKTPDIDNEKIKKLTKKPYMLFYYCNGIPQNLKRKIVDNAHKKGLNIIGAGEYDKLYGDMSIRLTPFEWAELFKRAEYVYTGTFHGVVFSILNRKDFKVYASIESRVKKINALLNQFEIDSESVMINENLTEFSDKNIDYDSIYEKIENLRDSSEKYIIDSVDEHNP